MAEPTTNIDVTAATDSLKGLGTATEGVFKELAPLPLRYAAATRLESTSDPDDKAIFGLSLRGILASMVTATLCALVLRKMTIDPNFLAIAMLCIGFYFGKVK